MKIFPDNPDEQSAIRAEVTQYLFSGSAGAQVTGGALAALLALALWGTSSNTLLVGWLVTVELSYLVRVALAAAYRRAGSGDASRWLNRLRVSVIVTGLIWGGGTLLLFPSHNLIGQTALAFTLAGLTAGSAMIYAIDAVALIGILIPLTLPLIYRLLGEGTQQSMAMSAMVILYCGFIAFSLRRSHRAMHENIRLRIEAVKRKEALLRAKESAEAALERATMAERKIVDISEETRERIGQELHDDLGQHLTGVAFLSEVLGKKLAKQGWPEMQIASEITTLLNQAVLNTRQLAQGLYPVELEEAGLQAMLGQLAGQLRSIYKIDCEVEYDENFRAEDRDVAINLFRIAQEAANNAIKHGGATLITIRTSLTPEAGLFEIADNGCGMGSRSELDKQGGLGMHTMQYRASLIGAVLLIGEPANGGTNVIIRFPVQ